MANNLVKGSGCGTREWREDFVLTDTDQVTALFKVALASGNLTIGASKFTVAASSGDLAINTNKFTVAGASGNTLVAGTLAVTGASTLTGAVAAQADLSAGTSMTLSSIETGLTAHAGGTQGAALALSAAKIVHVVSTVGSAADSVVLPAATGSGKVHIVSNQAAANSMQLFGLASDTINAAVAATGIAVAAKKTAICVDYAAGTWLASVSA